MKKLSIYDPKTLGSLETCYYCGIGDGITADHFYPKSKGGRLKVRCCKSCNKRKRDMTPLEWIAHLKKRGKAEINKRLIFVTESLWERVQCIEKIN